MRQPIYVMVLVAAFGCTTQLDEERADDPAEAPAAEAPAAEAPAAWTQVARGVWERAVPGGNQRYSVGLDGLRYVLEHARQERAALVAADRPETELAKIQGLIDHLEGRQQELSIKGSPEPAPTGPPQTNNFDPWDGSAPDDVTGSMCAGNYAFRVTFTILNLANYRVEARATWSQFGPFPTWTTTLYTYATAIGGDGILRVDQDTLGPFVSCCASVTSEAVAAVTWTPRLFGYAEARGGNGCDGYASMWQSLGY